MTGLRSTAAPVIRDRFHFAFSTNGRHGVCVAADDADGWALESWALTEERPTCRTITDVPVGPGARALPLCDGRILLLQRGERGAGHRHELMLLAPSSGATEVRRLGEIPARFGCELLASPGTGQLGFAVALEDPEHSTIWRVSSASPTLVPIAGVPGVLTDGSWLDRDAIALNQTSESGRCSGIAVDLAGGSWRRIWSLSDTSNDRIVASCPHSKLLVVSTDTTGEERLGWGVIGESSVHFPGVLHRSGHPRRVLTLDDRGERMLVHEMAGAVSRLSVYTPALDRLEPLDGPPGIISSPARWTGDLIRAPFSAPACPATLGTIRLGEPSRWSSAIGQRPAGEPGWAEADLVEVPGGSGPIEAIVYGGADWRHSPHLLVALHGGPLSSWRFEFDPLFQRLAAAGVAIVAPNYRGSTGYGDEHLRAVVGDWGGPDLQDVLALGRALKRARAGRRLPAPTVLGASYGAFLALLAAGTEPELWSACVALAPFLSAPRLHAVADIGVRHRVERLGGLAPTDDGRGPRDVLSHCRSLWAPLLLVHGTNDHTIPVEQSRTLRRHLLELGRTEGVDLEYLETDSDHDGVVLTRTEALRQAVVRFCIGVPGVPTDPPPTPESCPTAQGGGGQRVRSGRT